MPMNRSHAVSAKLIVPPSGSIDGVLLDQTDVAGGWTLYVRNGKPTYLYSFVGVESHKITAADPLPVGEHELRLEFAYDERGASGEEVRIVTLLVDGAIAGWTRLTHAHASVAIARS